MNEHFNGESVIGPITITLLKETGWYLPTYKAENDMTWGKERGCEFLSNPCNPTTPGFCGKADVGKELCLADSFGMGTCT